MNHTQLQHGVEWDGEEIDFSGCCCVTEKLDGFRALWDGEKLVSRQGKVFSAPAEFIANLPVGIPLDGEIWAGREFGHDAVNGFVRSGKWDRLKFVAFDAPAHESEFQLDRLASIPLTVPVVQFFIVKCLADLGDALKFVAKVGGEGVMIRERGRYTAGRGFGIIKAYCDRLHNYQF